MPNVPQISDAEWEVMKVVWERQPVSAAEVVERLGRERRWSPRTIRTMLNRLLAKRAIDYRPEGKRYLYRSRISRDACVRQESRSFLSRVFDGAAAPAVMHLLTHCDVEEFRKLSPDELQHLRQLLDPNSGADAPVEGDANRRTAGGRGKEDGR
jgi:BlaI family transcriptional regulator, penicillinase repressor